ncbi:hybrid sensor histidine kinase/response regulator [Desulfovulcanus sp.]
MSTHFKSERREIFEQLIGLGPKSMHKTYYPELKKKINELERFKHLLDQSNDLIILVELPTGKIIDANETAARKLGFEHQELLNQFILNLLEDNTTTSIKSFLNQTNTSTQVMEVDLIGNHGHAISVEINCKLVQIGSKKYGVLIARDISERKKAEYEMDLQKAYFEQLFTNSPAAIVMCDIKCNVIDINTSFTRIFGYTLEEMKGKNLDLFIIPSGYEQEAQTIIKLLHLGEIIDIETKRKNKQGRLLHFQHLAFPIYLGGEIIGIFAIYVDITEKKLMEEELIKSQRLESLGFLAGGIAHDFNNILAGILGNISLIQVLIKDNPKVLDVLNKAQNACLRARDLTQQLLTFAKGGEPVKTVFSLDDLLKESVSFLLSGSNVKYIFDLDPDLWAVNGDMGQINQVVQNLVINADQAMPSGGEIQIKARNWVVNEKENSLPLPSGKYVQVRIKDNGIGIRPQDISKIFDPYFTTKQTGSGLGLSITYSIIKKHGGHIEVRSELGQGTEFIFYLPAIEDSLHEAVEEKSEKQKRGRILFMDDEQDLLEVTKELLEQLGHEVTCVQDGQQAVDEYIRAQKNGRPYDVVILDITVPGGMGGKEAIIKLKEFDPQVKAVVSSGYSTDPIIANHKDYGFVAGIIKPYKMDDLHDLIQRTL